MSTTDSPTKKAGARDRLVAAAERLFYADGIRAVGVDRLSAEAKVSKRSLYQHFGGKDDVIVAMLDARAAAFRAGLPPAGETSPRERIVAVFGYTHQLAQTAEFRGCPFVSAATELKDREHPGAVAAREHKVELTSYFEELAREAGAADPATLALQLTLVFDGASAYAVVRGGTTPATLATVELLLTAHGL